jgi:hypothetical protein
MTMAKGNDHEERFRRLPKGVTADLFEHFGIPVNPAPSPLPEQEIEGAECDNCGWLRALADRSPCLICGYLGRRTP